MKKAACEEVRKHHIAGRATYGINENGELLEFIQLYMKEVPNLQLNRIAEQTCEQVRHLLVQSYKPTNNPNAPSKAEYNRDLNRMLRELEEDLTTTLKERINGFVFDRRR